MKTATASDTAVSGGGIGAPSAAAVRVSTLERELASARNIYTDKHPEIVRLRDELTDARTEAAAESSKPEEQRVATLRVDPTYRGLTQDREQARLRIRELQRQQSDIQGQIGMYRSRVESAPRVEQQIATLRARVRAREAAVRRAQLPSCARPR